MANLTETATYDAGVYQLETTDPVQGGAAGKSNVPLKNLANRTAWLKQQVDNILNGTTVPTGTAPLASPTFTGDPKAPTAALGDTDTSIATTAFVQATVGGILTKSVAGAANVTLTAAEAGNAILTLTGAITANITVSVPASPTRDWLVVNNTTGAFTVTVKTPAGTGVVVPQTRSSWVYSNGTNVVASLSAINGPLVGITDLAYSGTLTGGAGVVNLGDQFFKDASGNIGVGTTSPAAALQIGENDVYRELRMSRNVAGNSGQAVNFQRGRGTSVAPAALAASDFSGSVIFTGYDSSAYQPLARIDGGADAALTAGSAPGRLIFSTTASGAVAATERMRIDSVGNVGIGTTAPARRLVVSEQTRAITQVSSTSTTSTDALAGYEFNSYDGAAVSQAALIAQYSSIHTAKANILEFANYRVAPITFLTSATAGAAVERMRIDSAGNVGIGTSTPTGPLMVASTNAAVAELHRNADVSVVGPAGVLLGFSSRVGASIFRSAEIGGTLESATAGSMLFSTRGASGIAERMRITANGDVIINHSASGPSNTNSLYAVASQGSWGLNHSNSATGTTYLTFNYNGASIGSVSQNGTTGVTFNTASDHRLKANPVPLAGSGAFIDALQPKEWLWESDGSRGAGFIAHEVQEVSPSSVTGVKDAVDENGNPIHQSMGYGSPEIIANMVAELKSLRARVALLEQLA